MAEEKNSNVGALLKGGVLMAVALLMGTNLKAAVEPLEGLAWHSSLSSRGPLSAVTYGNGQFVAVGGKNVLSSPDGVNWMTRDGGTNFSALAITYGNGLFVAVGANGAILTSPDAASWTKQSSPTLDGLSAITYGNGLFVAVGDGTILTSPDAITWTSRSSGTSPYLRAVTYGNGLYVAVGRTNIVTSSDGIDWIQRTSGATNASYDLSGVAFGNGVFVAVGLFRTILTSSDGVNWKPHSIGIDAFSFAVTYGGGRFVALGNGPALISIDGITWTQISLPTGQVGLPARSLLFSGITYGDGHFVGVGDLSTGNPFIMTSSDGVAWSVAGNSVRAFLERGQFRTIAYGNGHFVLGGDTSFILVSPDGQSWSLKYPGVRAFVSGIAYGSGRFVAVGPANYYPNGSAGGGAIRGSTVATSPDGDNWEAWRIETQVRAVTFGAEQFVAVGDYGALLTSPDGVAWTARNSGTTNSLVGVAYGGDQFVAVGANGTILSSSDGSSWASRSSGTTDRLQAVAYGGGLFVAVGAEGTILTASNDGIWMRRISPTTNSLWSAAFGNTLFVIGGDSGLFVSRDAVSWVPNLNPSGPSPWPVVSGVAYGDGKFLAVGNGILEANLAQPILSNANATNGRFEFLISGEIGRVYRIQAASNLTSPNWTDVGAITNTQVTVPFIDRGAINFPNRFYRAALVP